MMAIEKWDKVKERYTRQIDSLPLAVFRLFFGLLLFVSSIRFIKNGWVAEFYCKPTFHFTFYLFDWVKPLSEMGMNTVFLGMLLCSLLITFGLFYRVAICSFFLLFTYVELIDKTYYLNHYYFVSLVSLLLCFLPANGSLSLDVQWRITPRRSTIPYWCIFVLQLQVGLVYFFAGIAKINSDWLLTALPLRIWLPSKAEIPVFGFLFLYPATAFVFSWFGMLFDTFVVFFLWNRKTVWYAYFVLVIFHLATAILFPMIGVFPFVMILAATIFLPPSFFRRFVKRENPISSSVGYSPTSLLAMFLAVFFSFQMLMPFRYLSYPGHLFVTEEGYRFSWRVMLMEKAGYSFFTVRDIATGKRQEINQADFLNDSQRKQMNTQPDMLLQFAKYLKASYAKQNKEVEVYVESYVSINGRASRLYLDSSINLAAQNESFAHKKWILD